jgi:hypothetical protein
MIIKNDFLSFPESNKFIEWFESEGTQENNSIFEDEKLADRFHEKLLNEIPLYIENYKSIGVLESFWILKLQSDISISDILKTKVKSRYEKVFYKILILLNESKDSSLKINGEFINLKAFQILIIPEHNFAIDYYSSGETNYILTSSLIYRDIENMFLESKDSRD